MDRIDKVISSNSKYTRNDVKKLIRLKRVKVFDKVILKSDYKVDIDKDIIYIDDNILTLYKNIYLILNKPKGYISATFDNNDLTVLDLIDDKYKSRDIFPAGRLDKDTTGMMIITDDGVFSHNILSPSKHISKTYRVVIDKKITDLMIEGFKRGVKLVDGVCKSSELSVIDDFTCLVTLTEGKYHQIKRMFLYYGAKVLELKRIKMGNLYLPDDLEEGQYRELTSYELLLLQEKEI